MVSPIPEWVVYFIVVIILLAVFHRPGKIGGRKSTDEVEVTEVPSGEVVDGHHTPTPVQDEVTMYDIELAVRQAYAAGLGAHSLNDDQKGLVAGFVSSGRYRSECRSIHKSVHQVVTSGTEAQFQNQQLSGVGAWTADLLRAYAEEQKFVTSQVVDNQIPQQYRNL